MQAPVRFLSYQLNRVSSISTSAIIPRESPLGAVFGPYDIAGLPFLSWVMGCCFFVANTPNAAAPRMMTCSGIIITMRYNAVLLSLHSAPQCGFTCISIEDHWQLQLWMVETVFEELTP